MEEIKGNKCSGFPMLVVALIILLLTIAGFFAFILPGILMLVVLFFVCKGFLVINPNEAQVLVFFGKYTGTIKEHGFWWTNPFAVKRTPSVTTTEKHQQTLSLKGPYRISLRLRNFVSEKLKVNDKRGNPIEIGAVIVWRVVNTANVLFEVDDYVHYVRVQSETALRHLASIYPYDHICEDDEEGGITLRDNGEEVCEALKQELQERLKKAGVQIEEARIMHLAYAPEIASAMLRRQQAEAVIAARQKIVTGAVGMVEMALEELSAKQVVDLDPQQKAAMVGNLLVVLCGESEAEPVIQAGSI